MNLFLYVHWAAVSIFPGMCRVNMTHTIYKHNNYSHTPQQKHTTNNQSQTPYVLKFRHQSDEYITTIPEKIDTAANVQ